MPDQIVARRCVAWPCPEDRITKRLTHPVKFIEYVIQTGARLKPRPSHTRLGGVPSFFRGIEAYWQIQLRAQKAVVLKCAP